MTDKSQKTKEHWTLRFLPLGIILVVVIVMSLNWFVLKDNTQRGQWGDIFGLANALFSGLALGGLVYAILLQRRELMLQREELEATRKELKGQKEQLQLQNDTLQTQRFENTFFQLLRLHNEIVGNMRISDAFAARKCFRYLFDQLRSLYGTHRDRRPKEENIQAIESAYLRVFEQHQASVGHYFRNLYNIVKFVDRSEVLDKGLYTNLIRAQLSSDELLLLFYNCLSSKGRDKFKPLIERYTLLKTLDRKLLIDPEAHYGLYELAAYGRDGARPTDDSST